MMLLLVAFLLIVEISFISSNIHGDDFDVATSFPEANDSVPTGADEDALSVQFAILERTYVVLSVHPGEFSLLIVHQPILEFPLILATFRGQPLLLAFLILISRPHLVSFLKLAIKF
jgi:hypothetical protein